MELNFANYNGIPKDERDDVNGNVVSGSHTEPTTIYNFQVSSHNGNYTYKEYGFIQSKNHGANPVSLEMDLNKIFEMFKDNCQGLKICTTSIDASGIATAKQCRQGRAVIVTAN